MLKKTPTSNILGLGCAFILGLLTIQASYGQVNSGGSGPGRGYITSAQIDAALGYTPATSALASGDLFVGNSSNVAIARALSGDCSISNTGVITCTKTSGSAFTALATTTPATGCASFLATPTSANLQACMTDETGAGALYFAGGNAGTPSAINLTNATSVPAGQLSGTIPASVVKTGNTSGSVTAGNVGETISSLVQSSGAISLSSTNAADITSISLTAGEWLVSGTVCTKSGGSTVTSLIQGWINSTSANTPTKGSSGFTIVNATIPTGADGCYPTGSRVFNSSSSFTAYLSMNDTFATSTQSGYGQITAVRIQ